MTQKTQVISVVQEKGGAGKTTWLCTLAALMAEDGAKVFAIDTDERKHLSRWLEKDKTPVSMAANKLGTAASFQRVQPLC